MDGSSTLITVLILAGLLLISLILVFVSRRISERKRLKSFEIEQAGLSFFFKCLDVNEISEIENSTYFALDRYKAEYEEAITRTLKKYCEDKKLDFDYHKLLYKKGREKYKKEVERINKRYSDIYQYTAKGLPGSCPGCSKCLVIVSEESDNPQGKHYPKSRSYKNLWVEAATVEAKTTHITDAWTLGGATTVFTQEGKRTIKQYKCPNCGYLYTKG